MERTFNRKSPYVFVLVVILVLAFGVALYFEQSINHNVTQPTQAQVKIASFSVDTQWGALAGLTMGCKFNLTIQNVGAGNLSGLMLNITVSINGTKIPYGTYFDGTYENNTLIEPLAPGEVKVCDGVIMFNLGTGTPMFAVHSNDTSVKASVSLDGVILFERESA